MALGFFSHFHLNLCNSQSIFIISFLVTFWALCLFKYNFVNWKHLLNYYVHLYITGTSKVSKGNAMDCDWVEIRHVNQNFVIYLCLDLGWLETFDEYFRERTQYIFNNMVVKLKEDSRRKFIWSEISYLSKWWDTIDIKKKDAVKRFVLKLFLWSLVILNI